MSHFLFYVVVEKDEAANEQDAIYAAESDMDASHFCYPQDGGFFSGGRCDYFKAGEIPDYWTPGIPPVCIVNEKILEILRNKHGTVPIFISSDLCEVTCSSIADEKILGKWLVALNCHR